MISLIKSVFKTTINALRGDPELNKIVIKHPKAYSFIKKRLSPDETFGLYLTLGIFFTFIFTVIFYSILKDYLDQEAIVQADQSILNFISLHRTAVLNQIMLFITYSGSGMNVALGVLFTCIILFLLKRFYYLLTLLVSVIFGEGIVFLIKNLVERPRPPIAKSLVTESSFSFPSGHSFIAISFYGLLLYFIFRSVNKKYQKTLTFLAAVLVMLLIGISRIYLGVHWTSDVLASYAVGLAWLSMLITATKIKDPKTVKPLIPKKTIYYLIFIFFVSWFSFLTFYYFSHPIKTPPKVSIQKINIDENLTEKLFDDLPRFSETMFGNQIEPINIILVGDKSQIISAFEKADWQPLDTFNVKNLLILSKRSIFQESYPTAPGFPSFWNTQPNSLEFNQATARNSAQERYHIHLWETPYLVSNTSIWVGTAHFDKYQKTFLPVHRVDPPLDETREKIKNDLFNANKVDSYLLTDITNPTMGQNLFGSKFFTDGKAYLMYLKN
jgi:undecaprenyl-diphosphatase